MLDPLTSSVRQRNQKDCAISTVVLALERKNYNAPGCIFENCNFSLPSCTKSKRITTDGAAACKNTTPRLAGPLHTRREDEGV